MMYTLRRDWLFCMIWSSWRTSQVIQRRSRTWSQMCYSRLSELNSRMAELWDAILITFATEHKLIVWCQVCRYWWTDEDLWFSPQDAAAEAPVHHVVPTPSFIPQTSTCSHWLPVRRSCFQTRKREMWYLLTAVCICGCLFTGIS